jgi:hypothetical protein
MIGAPALKDDAGARPANNRIPERIDGWRLCPQQDRRRHDGHALERAPFHLVFRAAWRSNSRRQEGSPWLTRKEG